MKLKVSLQKEPNHEDLVCCVAWLNADEVFSAGDDHKIVKWNQLSGDASTAVQLGADVFATDLHWFPNSSGGKKAADVCVLASGEGKFLFVSRAGRIEKTVEAHRGAVLVSRWSHDGNALLTSGEDGQVKVWSRSGMLRSTLVSGSVPIYSAAWSPNSDAILHSSGKSLVIKPLQPSSKPVTWKAHDAIILKVDWNMVNNTIISGGEDCRYKVFDTFGRVLYTSPLHDYPITSLAWTPDGELFAVGSFNTLRLCDKAGWSYALEKPNTGSLFSISWANDGTQLAGACGNGQVIFANIIERRLEWKNLEVTAVEQKNIKVRDVMTDAKENLDFRDRIVKFSIAHDHLVVATSSQCYIYSVKNWNTPMISDLKSGSVALLLLAEKHFLLADDTGIQIISYEGRLVSSPKYADMRAGLMSKEVVSLSNDTVVVRDRADEKALYFFEALSGKPIGDGKPIMHSCEIVEIALSQAGSATERQLVFMDKNKDLFIRAVRTFGTERVIKLASQVTTVCWNDNTNVLVTVSDNKFSVWYYPTVAYVDQQLIARTTVSRDASEFGRGLYISNFVGTYVSMRRGDGSVCTTSISPYPAFLHKFYSEEKWDDAVRLCRFVKEEAMWACLAGMAAYAKNLSTAEIAYAAIEEAEKVHFINHIKSIPSSEGRASAMSLFCGQVSDAEATLLQAGLIYRAIQMNIDLFNWTRALELAVKHKTHVDTVLAYRAKYMQKLKREEKDKNFLQFTQGVEVDWDKIHQKIEVELEKESQRPGASVHGI